MARKVHVTLEELEDAFEKHLEGAKQTKGSVSHMMLAYAAECGLKMIWLFNNFGRTTEDIGRRHPELLGSHGHDLSEWIRELKVSHGEIPISPPTFHLVNRRGDAPWDASYAHQAWRYHAAIHAGDEHALVNWLNQICGWVKRKKRR